MNRTYEFVLLKWLSFEGNHHSCKPGLCLFFQIHRVMLWNVEEGRFLMDELSLVPLQIRPDKTKPLKMVRALMHGLVGLKICNASNSQKRRLTLLLAIVKLRAYTQLHVLETFYSWIFVHTELHSNPIFKARCLLNHRRSWLVWVFFMFFSFEEAKPWMHLSIHRTREISDTAHCQFSHITALDSCVNIYLLFLMMETLICFWFF